MNPFRFMIFAWIEKNCGSIHVRHGMAWHAPGQWLCLFKVEMSRKHKNVSDINLKSRNTVIAAKRPLFVTKSSTCSTNDIEIISGIFSFTSQLQAEAVRMYTARVTLSSLNGLSIQVDSWESSMPVFDNAAPLRHFSCSISKKFLF